METGRELAQEGENKDQSKDDNQWNKISQFVLHATSFIFKNILLFNYHNHIKIVNKANASCNYQGLFALKAAFCYSV